MTEENRTAAAAATLPYDDWTPALKEDLGRFLADFVTAERRRLMAEVLAQRTRYLTVVLEDIYQPHNASACIRSCDCFGVQDVHIVEEENEYRVNRDITLGSAQWVTLHRYRDRAGESTRRCLDRLRRQGYCLVATTLRAGSVPLQELELDQKTALLFGAEETGLSPQAHEMADRQVQIPMVGFTQSLNISVSVAVTLYELTNRLRASELPWGLSEAERQDLHLTWLIQSATRGEALVRHFRRQHGLAV